MPPQGFSALGGKRWRRRVRPARGHEWGHEWGHTSHVNVSKPQGVGIAQNWRSSGVSREPCEREQGPIAMVRKGVSGSGPELGLMTFWAW